MKRHHLLALSLCCLTTIAPAQEGPPAKDLLLARQVFIALRPNVVKEIKLTDAQRGKVLDAFHGGLEVEGERVRIMITGDESMDDMVTAAMKVLEPSQKARLQEIWLQDAGSLAILEPSIAKELGVSKEQAAKADKVAQSVAADIMDLFRDMQGDHDEAAKKVNALRDGARKQFDSLLSDDQKKKLEGMKGKAFKLKAKDGL